MEKQKVLIIDDDENICRILKDYFEYEGYEVAVAHSGNEGLEKIKQEKPHVIILDIMLPEVDGWDICQRLRPADDIPIIMLSAKDKDTDRITGLELGADDYVTKPFSPKEVVARVKALLRRTRQEKEESMIEFPDLKLNKEERSVQVNSREVGLTPKEFELFWLLASSPRQVFQRDMLLEMIWGYSFLGDSRTLDTHIKSLRNKLGKPARDYIKTVWGVGYKFEVSKDA